MSNMLYILLFLFAVWFGATIVDPVHCSDCPSAECLCIQDVDGNWMLSPEVGE